MWNFNQYFQYFNYYSQYNQFIPPNFFIHPPINQKIEDQRNFSRDSISKDLILDASTKNSAIKIQETGQKSTDLINGLISQLDAQILCQNKIKKIWSNDQISKLMELVEKYQFNWDLISSQFVSKTSSQCQNKYRKLNSLFGVQRWTLKDDQLIKSYYQTFGNNWIKYVPYFKNKSSRQIRQRYLNYLAPNLQTKQWTFQQDLQLSKLVQQYGRKWKTLENYFVGRSQNTLKNRYYGHIQRILKLKQKELNKKKLK